MQIKTIQKIISNKLNEWLETITDEKLKLSVKENILLSGGAITSLFLNQDVNDYDIYIKDMDVLLSLIKYYINEFKKDIIILDGREKHKLNNFHKDDKSYYAIAVKTLKEKQLKLCFKAKNGGMPVNKNKDLENSKYHPLFFSPNAISLSDNIQIVIRFHGDNEEIHKTFDFVHATNYFTFEKGLVTNIKALESILTKQLFYQGSLYPLTSIIRMKKFIKRNWNISAGEILKILFQVSELDLKNPDVLEEQLIGIDVAYFSKLIEILRGVDAKDLTSQYINTIIDKVFNSAEDNEE